MPFLPTEPRNGFGNLFLRQALSVPLNKCIIFLELSLAQKELLYILILYKCYIEQGSEFFKLETSSSN